MAKANRRSSGPQKEISPEIMKLKERDSKMVRGKFIFHEVPGGKMDFSYLAYPGESIKTYSMTDGEIQTIPYGVAKHLNTNCWYPTYKYSNDDQGRPSMKIGQKVRRCSFQSLEFMDIEGVKPVGSSTSAIESIKE